VTPLPRERVPEEGKAAGARRLLGPLIPHAWRQDRALAARCRQRQHPLSTPASRNLALPASRERLRPLAGATSDPVGAILGIGQGDLHG
jgi:hypothetical protein